MAPWLIFPEKSDFYKIWMFVLTATLQVELFCTPVVLVWPQYLVDVNKLLWACDAVWLISILMGFITIRYDMISRDQFDVASAYIKGEFIFDLIATLPTMFSNHNTKFMLLRLIHIVHI